MVRHRMAGFVALVLISVLAPAAAQAKPRGYLSPGYKGTNTFGKNVTANPLPPITLGTGKYPNLLVDAAGTAHVVYTQDGGADAPDTLVSCLLQRGQKQCAAGQNGLAPVTPEGGTPGPFAGNFPGGNHDTDGAVPLNLGNQLYVVQRRFPNVVTAPDGSNQQSNVFLWSSDDGGANLTGPGIIGDNQMAGGAIVFGGASPTIGTISDRQTDGTWFQASQVGTYVQERAWIGRPPFIADGTAALDGTLPIAAFSDASGTIMVRRWNGQVNVNDSPNWSQASFPGFDPEITSGPNGVFVMYREADNSGSVFLRRIVNGVPAPTGTKISDAVGQPTFAQNPAGGLALAFADTESIQLMTSPNGTSWSTPQVIAKLTGGETVERLTAAATGDGGGFVSYVKNPVGAEGVGSVVLSAFGTQRATGNPGLGPLPGGGIGSAVGDQLATTTCTTVKFGKVTAENNSCFGRDQGNPNMAVSLGEINLNGLRIIPDKGAKIGIDPKRHTIDTVGKVRVVLSAGDVEITLWHDELHVKLPTAEAGTDLFDFKNLPKPPDVVGFPIAGSINVTITKDGGVSIPISLGLPKVFGGVTGSATLTATLRGGLQLDSLEFKVPNADFKAIAIKDLDIRYRRQGTVWSGKGTIQVPSGGGVFTLTVDVEFADGEFQKGSVDLGLPYPGIPIDPTPQLYFTRGGLDLFLSPLGITGRAGFGLSPFKAPGTGGLRDYVFSLDGSLNATFGDPITITAEVQGFLQALKIADGKLVYQLPSRVTLTGQAGFDLGIVDINGSVQAIFDPKTSEYAARIGSTVTLRLDKVGVPSNIDIPGLTVAVNKRGFAVYIPPGATPFFIGTVAYDWGALLPKPFPFQDKTGRYAQGVPPLRRGTARGAQTATSFEVAKGTEAVSVQVSGQGGAPSVVLTDPSGKQITPAATADGDAFSFGDAAGAQTYVGLRKPAAGRWNVTQAPGSTIPVTGVSFSAQTAKPTVKAKLGGKGRARTLSYTATLPKGTTVKFAERTSALLRVFGTAKGSKGTLRFSPADGPAGKREIVALIESEGLPQSQPVLATYAAPGPPVPGRSKSVKVTSTSKAFTVSWTPPPGAYRTLVAITANDGRRIQRVLPASTKRLAVPVIGFKNSISVTVTGLSRTGKKGPAVRAKAARKT